MIPKYSSCLEENAHICVRSPQRRHWQLLNQIDDRLLDPYQFLSFWEITHSDFARICGCSVSTVDHWFSDGQRHREPTLVHKTRLEFVHNRWKIL